MPIFERTWKKSDGTEVTRYYLHRTIDGVRYRELIPSARNITEAKRAADKIIAQIHEGKYGRRKKSPLFKEFAEQTYLPYSREIKRSHRNDESRIKPIVEHFGKKRLKDISAFDIEAYKIKRKNTPIIFRHKDGTESTQRPRSLAVINREVCLLSAIFTLAVKKKEATNNPCKEVDHLIFDEQERERYLQPDEETKLLPVLEQRPYLRDMVVLAINTGMREGELFGPERIDFARNFIVVTKTKSGKDRKVPMNEETREILTRLVEVARVKEWDYIFTNPKTGTRYKSIKTAWANMCKLAKIANLRFHDLRHSFATRAADEGVPLTAIARVLGHASTKTTERYAHGTDSGVRWAVEAVQKKQPLVTNRSHDRRKEEVA
jgi:integrase